MAELAENPIFDAWRMRLAKQVTRRKPLDLKVGFEWLLALTVLSLFTNIRFWTGFVWLRPFELLVATMFFKILLSKERPSSVAFPVGAAFLFPYLFWHVFSAFTLGVGNGMREGLQISVLFILLFDVLVVMDRLDYAKFGRIMLIGLLLVTAYNVIWHLANGYPTGWKHLNDPKAAFTFLPMVMAAIMLFSKRGNRLYWVIWAVYGLIELQSGERKALMVYLVLSAVLLSRGRLVLMASVIAVALGVLSAISATTDDPYVKKQISTMLGGESTETYQEVYAGAPIASLSNTQRAFAADLSKRFLKDHPLLGVGTNGYLPIVAQRFSYLPSFMCVSIHGEFLRIVTENGYIGLLLYLLIWAVAFVRLVQTLVRLRRFGWLGRGVITSLPLIFFVPTLFYIGFEAAGTHSFVVLIFISLSADLVPRCLHRLRMARPDHVLAVPAHFAHFSWRAAA